MNKLIFALSPLVLAACAHVEVAAQNDYAKPRSGYGVVYFYRENHFSGGGTSYNVWDNDTKPPVKVGALKNSSYFFVYVKPGHYQYVVNGETQGAADFKVAAGETHYVQNRIDVGFWAARPKLTEVTASEAEKELHESGMEMTIPAK